jgi:hypothetical protein
LCQRGRVGELLQGGVSHQRDRAGIRAGDKLVLISWTKDDEVCCISLMKADGLVDMVKDRLGPLMADIL